MAEMFKIAVKYLNANKLRTFLTASGIILSVVLLSSLILFKNSHVDYVNRQETFSSGDYQIMYDVSQADKIESMIDKAYIDETIAVYDYGVSKTENGSYLLVHNVTKGTNMQGFQIWEGTFPNKEKEALISKDYADMHQLKIGDTFDITIGKRTVDQKRIAYNDVELYEGEVFHATSDIDHIKVSGIYKGSDSINTAGISDEMIIYLDKKGTSGIVYTKLKNSAKTLWPDLKEKILQEDTQVHMGLQTGINEYGEHLLLGDKETNPIEQTFQVIIVVIFIMMIALICNLFTISLEEKRKYIGMLKSMGATNKQVFSISLFEALLYAMISIPIGILISLGSTSFIIDHIVHQYMDNEIVPFSYRLMMEPSQILTISICVISIILISCFISAKKNYRISPIALIKNHEDRHTKKVKSFYFTENLFGIESKVGKRYQYQNKTGRRSIFIVVTLSLILLFTGSFLMDCLGKLMSSDESSIVVNFKNIATSDQYKKLRSVVKQCVDVSDDATYRFESGFLLNDVKFYDTNKSWDIQQHLKMQIDTIQINSIETPNRIFKNDDDSILSNEIIYHTKDGKDMVYHYFKFDENGMFTLPLYSFENKKTVDFDFKVVPDVSYDFIQVEEVYEGSGHEMLVPKLYISPHHMETLLKKMNYESVDGISLASTVRFYHMDSDELYANLQKVNKDNPGWIDDIQMFDDQASNASLDSMYLILFAITITVLIVSILNLLCISICNALNRKRENAIVFSLGIEKKQFIKMLFFENADVLLKAYLISIPVSITLYTLIYYVLFRNQILYSIAWNVLLYGFIFVVLLIVQIIAILMFLVNKNNTIETLRLDD